MPSYLIEWLDSFGESHCRVLTGTDKDAELFKFKRELAGNFPVTMIEIKIIKPVLKNWISGVYLRNILNNIDMRLKAEA